jgi:hypothetical protein
VLKVAFVSEAILMLFVTMRNSTNFVTGTTPQEYQQKPGGGEELLSDRYLVCATHEVK